MTRELTGITELFCIEGPAVSVTPVGNGHINDTYLVCTETRKYIMQRINTDVFSDVDALMENVVSVTKYLGGRLEYIPARTGNYYCRYEGGECDAGINGTYRMMSCIDDAYSCEASDDPDVFYEIGKAYGSFISELADFPIESLNETIPDFHNTAKRFDDLKRAIDADAYGRKDSAAEEIRFALDREQDADVLCSMAARGMLPVRVTHNDTKINNVMLDRETGHAACVIDLDTVMPGLAVHDFGDAVRSGACTGREDEEDLRRIRLDLNIYRSLARGFMDGFPEMTEQEKKMMPDGARIMTLECGIRFLTDYLEGDKYFKTDYPGHNLVRCRTQFRLAENMEANRDEMQAIVNSIM